MSTLLPGYAPPPDSEMAKAVKDVSIVAVFVVIAIILIVSFSVYLMVRFLRGVVSATSKLAPAVGCAAWLEARRLSYVNGSPAPINPATNNPYTPCEAVSQAVADAQTASSGLCPVVTTPPPAAQQAPYAYYMSARQCPS